MLTKQSTVVLGREFDDDLRADLKLVLNDLGAIFCPVKWGVGGSQEVEGMTVLVRGESLLVEAETYIGLSIFGAEGLVTEVKRMAEARVAQRREANGAKANGGDVNHTLDRLAKSL